MLPGSRDFRAQAVASLPGLESSFGGKIDDAATQFRRETNGGFTEVSIVDRIR